MDSPVRVLMITSEWPSQERPNQVPFLVQQVDFLRRSGAEVDVFSFRGAQNPLNYLSAWRNVRKELGRKQYDLIHAQFGQSALLAWPNRHPVVVTFHGDDILGVKGQDERTTIPGRMLQLFCKAIARRAEAVIIVSDHMRKHLRTGSPVHLIPTGVDLQSVPDMPPQQARRQLGLALHERLILFVGNPADPYKRYDLAKESVDCLNARLPARLVVGWNRPHREILVLMNACDVLVITSHQEGSPTIVKEALACNLPIVSVDVGDVAMRLQGVEGCEICLNDQPETIAASLERILRGGQRINGRESVKELDEKVLAEKLLGIYRVALSRYSMRKRKETLTNPIA